MGISPPDLTTSLSPLATRIALVGPPRDGDLRLIGAALEARGAATTVVDPDEAFGAVGASGLTTWPEGGSEGGFDAFLAPYCGPSRSRHALIDVFEASALPTLNSMRANLVAEDKWATTRALARAGLSQPRTILVGAARRLAGARASAARSIGYPVVLKTQFGYGGTGVALARCDDDIERFVTAHAFGKADALIISEFYAEAGGRDFRVVLLDDEVLAIKARWSGSDAEFRSAVPGNVVTRGEITPAETVLVRAACRGLGLVYAGVDLMRTAAGPIVIELNNDPALKQTQQVCGVDLAGAVAAALLGRIEAARSAT
jgi:ribosomal protein S6--L-glutamate ligase